MKRNIKFGNILSIILIVGIIISGISIAKSVSSKDMEIEILQKEYNLCEQHGKNLYVQFLETEKKVEQLEDSLKTMHIHYMNDSYIKENFEVGKSYWFIYGDFKTWKKVNGKTQTIYWHFQEVVKCEGVSIKYLYKAVEDLYDIDKDKNNLYFSFFKQVSQKSYYEWQEIDKDGNNVH